LVTEEIEMLQQVVFFVLGGEEWKQNKKLALEKRGWQQKSKKKGEELVVVFCMSLYVCYSLSSSYGWKHRPFEALGAGVPDGHPLASACCCRGIVTTVIATTPSNAAADN
jgi:hypothetical protein